MINMEEEIVNEINKILDFDVAQKHIILHKILSDDIVQGQKIDISDDVYKDTSIDKWAVSMPLLSGGKILMDKLIKQPINDRRLLEQRQNISINFDTDMEILRDYENDVLWIFKIAEEIKENTAIEILFPSSFILSYMNYVEKILDIYHIYKIYMIPLTSLLYPLSTILVPYYYVNKYLHMNLSLKTYLQMLWNLIKLAFRPSGNYKSDIIRITTIFLYIFLYLYNTYQTFEIAQFIYNTKQKLHEKMTGLLHFIKHAKYIMKTINEDHNPITAFFDIKADYDDIKIHNSMTDIYKLWKDDGLKAKIISLLKSVYAIDVIDSIYKLGWAPVNYDTDKTIIWDAKNPLLNDNQVANPVNLQKNIIITGPNAGGKTTYVKTILSNIILAHTFGITHSIKSHVVLYDTINSFMRISDVLGSKSYFEAEAEYCLHMIKKAQKVSETGKRGLFLMDEPMHSTPPIEGLATAYAVAEYLSSLTGVSLIITTHFHKLIILEELYADRFINLSVDAIPVEKGFYFPYQIRKGHSQQCIAIELMDSKDFPSIVIDNAIKMKNKICCDFNK